MSGSAEETEDAEGRRLRHEGFRVNATTSSPLAAARSRRRRLRRLRRKWRLGRHAFSCGWSDDKARAALRWMP
jgi:hypothetical protein